MTPRPLFLLLLIFLVLGGFYCNKPFFDYDDYETRLEYVQNIRAEEFLTDSILTVVTWNIKLAFPMGKNPWSEDIGGSNDHLDSLAQLLLEHDPDIVLLQEVPHDRENTVIKKVLDSIGHKMQYNYAFGGHGFNSNGAYPTRAQWGNAILSKYPIESIYNLEVFNLRDKWSRRSVLQARLEYRPNEYLDSYSLHYSTDTRSDAEFRTQVRKTRDHYRQFQNPIILGGDFNYSSSIDTILGLVHCRPPNYDNIDRIYVSDDFIPVQRYTTTERSVNFSDHLLGLVKVKLR